MGTHCADTKHDLEAPLIPWVLRSGWRLYSALFLVLAIPTAVLISCISFHLRGQLESHLARQNAMVSRSLALAIDEEFVLACWGTSVVVATTWVVLCFNY